MRMGRFEEARAAWQAALATEPPGHDAWYGYAEYCLYIGQEGEYRRARRALLSRFGDPRSVFTAERVSRACLLRPAPEDELRKAVALAERVGAVKRSDYPGAYPFFLFAKGLAEYRRGRFERAVALMRGDASRVLGPAPRLVLAMALHQSGQVAEARKTLEAAVVGHNWRADEVRDQDGWIYHVLRREAEGMILPDQPACLEGKHQPRDNDEREAPLGVSQVTNRCPDLASLYAHAFAAAPRLEKDFRPGHK